MSPLSSRAIPAAREGRADREGRCSRLPPKYGRYGACDFFGVCEFSVFVTNVGALPYTGTLNVSDVATTPGATMIDWADKGEWNCAATGPDAYGCSTTADVTLTPGDFRELIILVQGPPVAPGLTHVENCASIDWGGAIPDYNPHNEYACASISSLPPGHPDARPSVLIEKDSPATCFRGAPGVPWHCLFYVYVSNTGSAPLEGPIVINDTFSVNPATLVIGNSTPAGMTWAPGRGKTGRLTWKDLHASRYSRRAAARIETEGHFFRVVAGRYARAERGRQLRHHRPRQ